MLANVPPIKMRLDLLELAGADLIVTDVKTSRSRWNGSRASRSGATSMSGDAKYDHSPGDR